MITTQIFKINKIEKQPHIMGLQAATSNKRKYEMNASFDDVTQDLQTNCTPSKNGRWSPPGENNNLSNFASTASSTTTTTTATATVTSVNEHQELNDSPTLNESNNELLISENSIAKLEAVTVPGETWNGLEPIVDSISKLQAVAVPGETWGGSGGGGGSGSGDNTRSALATTLLTSDELDEDDDEFEDDFEDDETLLSSYSPIRYPCSTSRSYPAYPKPGYFPESYHQQNCSRTTQNTVPQQQQQPQQPQYPSRPTTPSSAVLYNGWNSAQNYYTPSPIPPSPSLEHHPASPHHHPHHHHPHHPHHLQQQQTIRCAENGKSYFELGSTNYCSQNFITRHIKRCCDGRNNWCNNKQCYKERRMKMMNLSMFKLSRFRQSADQSLYRSVLICNTLKYIEKEIEKENKEFRQQHIGNCGNSNCSINQQHHQQQHLHPAALQQQQQQHLHNLPPPSPPPPQQHLHNNNNNNNNISGDYNNSNNGGSHYLTSNCSRVNVIQTNCDNITTAANPASEQLQQQQQQQIYSDTSNMNCNNSHTNNTTNSNLNAGNCNNSGSYSSQPYSSNTNSNSNNNNNNNSNVNNSCMMSNSNNRVNNLSSCMLANTGDTLPALPLQEQQTHMSAASSSTSSYEHHPLKDPQSGRATPFPLDPISNSYMDTDSGYGGDDADDDCTRSINWGSVLSLTSQSALDPLNNNDLVSSSSSSSSSTSSSSDQTNKNSTSSSSSSSVSREDPLSSGGSNSVDLITLNSSNSPSSTLTTLLTTATTSISITPTSPTSPTSVSSLTPTHWNFDYLDMDLGGTTHEIYNILPNCYKFSTFTTEDFVKSSIMEPTKVVNDCDMDTFTTHIMVGS